MSLHDLQGAEIILPGLNDLHSGDRYTIGALLIAIAATRLLSRLLVPPSGVRCCK
jgi:hypothetical protein